MLSIVVAVAKNGAIGKENRLLWHLPNDLRHFRKITEGHTIVMGRKTFESIGRILPNRKHIVLTRNKNFSHKDAKVLFSLGDVLEHIEGEKQVYVIGGGEIYRLFLPYVKRIYLTEVDIEIEADTYFPTLDLSNWTVVQKKEGVTDSKNSLSHRFITLERK